MFTIILIIHLLFFNCSYLIIELFVCPLVSKSYFTLFYQLLVNYFELLESCYINKI